MTIKHAGFDTRSGKNPPRDDEMCSYTDDDYHALFANCQAQYREVERLQCERNDLLAENAKLRALASELVKVAETVCALYADTDAPIFTGAKRALAHAREVLG